MENPLGKRISGYRRRFPGWCIVEVGCKNGDGVEISL